MIDKTTLDAYNLKFTDYDKTVRDLNEHRLQDGAKGLMGPFKCLNEYYTHKESGVTDWTGFAGSGKTYMCLEYMISLANKYGSRFALFVPDIGSTVDVYDKLFKMTTGFDFHSKYRNQIPESEITKRITGLMYSFPVFEKRDIKKGVAPQDVWEYTAGFKDNDGSRLSGCLVDSWKNLKHSYSGREDLYLDEILSYRNELSEAEGIHIHTIAHAAKTDVGKDGKRRVPGPSDIKGGEAWNANGKNIITVDYPDKSKTYVNIFVNKVKPESVGRVGSVIQTIYLDRKRGRYFEFINGARYYAFEYEKLDEPASLEMDFGSGHVDAEELPF